MAIRDSKAIRSAEVILVVLTLSQIVLANSSSIANTIQFQGFYLTNNTCAIGPQNVVFNMSNGYITIVYNPLITVPTDVIYPNQTLSRNIGLAGSTLNIEVNIPSQNIKINATILGVGVSIPFQIPNINLQFNVDGALGSQVIQIPGATFSLSGLLINYITGGIIPPDLVHLPLDVSMTLAINLTALVQGTLTISGSTKNPTVKSIVFSEPTDYSIIATAENVPNGSIVIKLDNITYSVVARLVVLYNISIPLFSPISGAVDVPYIPALKFAVKGKPDCVAGYFRIKPYNITFIQRGLYPGASWSVTLNGVTKSTTGDRIVFYVPVGTFAYTVGSVSGYSASPSSGTIRVSGSNVTYVITFEPLRTTQNARVVTASSTYSTYSSSSAAYDMILIASIAIIIIGGAVAAVIIIRGSRGATG